MQCPCQCCHLSGSFLIVTLKIQTFLPDSYTFIIWFLFANYPNLVNPDPVNCVLRIIFPVELSLKTHCKNYAKRPYSKMEKTDLLKLNSESTHSSTDCWSSSALPTTVMCQRHNFQGQSFLKKNQLSVSKLSAEVISETVLLTGS